MMSDLEQIGKYWAILANIPPGSLIRFVGETLRHTVKASSDRFLILERKSTKNTITYTIVDLKYGVRSTVKSARVNNEEDRWKYALERLQTRNIVFKNATILDIDLIEWKK
jgi:hypothetical protein